ncbi:hypothetical protein GIB19_27655 [Pseudomonas sp. ITEM 17296]|uniref:Imm15 family immunity protein n=1 Tax=Pseudomonas sp. ITEM 17296 TaxID=2790281 RepID=UPI000C1251DD|nr:hypothetical protein CR512_15815 [Pseudomonas putida]MDE4540986.1 hypothetical protein [Pseudomonas sp. ITEM 17296]GLO58916.1 hypothetical protein PPUJ20066_49520 [Pseudomonas putida]
MNLQDTFNEIVKNEPWNEVSVFFDDYELFEEIPLVSRYKKTSILIRKLKITDITDILVNAAFFTLNSAMLYALKNNICTESRFLALSFTDFNLSNPEESPIPHFFIHARESRASFLKRLHSHNVQKTRQR